LKPNSFLNFPTKASFHVDGSATRLSQRDRLAVLSESVRRNYRHEL
jgi:hypothetical protein